MEGLSLEESRNEGAGPPEQGVQGRENAEGISSVRPSQIPSAEVELGREEDRIRGQEDKSCIDSSCHSAGPFHANLLQALGHAIICTDSVGHITYWNKAAERLYWWKSSEVLGRKITDFLSPAELRTLGDEVISKVMRGVGWSGEWRCTRKDGCMLDVMVTNTPIVDDQGNQLGVVGVSMNLKALKSAMQIEDETWLERITRQSSQESDIISSSTNDQLQDYIGDSTAGEVGAEAQRKKITMHDLPGLFNGGLVPDPSGFDDRALLSALEQVNKANKAEQSLISPSLDSPPVAEADWKSVGSEPESDVLVSLPSDAEAKPEDWETGQSKYEEAQESFNLQLQLALKVAAEADDSDEQKSKANDKPSSDTNTISKAEATAYRYWTSNQLSFDDRIEDGFYDVWGMSPHVWSMCMDSTLSGHMPQLEDLRTADTAEANIEVVLVDHFTDPQLPDLEDRAVSLAYEATEVIALASSLGKLVADVMGGSTATESELQEAWNVMRGKLIQQFRSIVVPIGAITTGLRRHRALLFKVLADSVGLPCRLIRDKVGTREEADSVRVIVKCSDEREGLVDLMANPGAILTADVKLATSTSPGMKFPGRPVSPLRRSTGPSEVEAASQPYGRSRFGAVRAAAEQNSALPESSGGGEAEYLLEASAALGPQLEAWRATQLFVELESVGKVGEQFAADGGGAGRGIPKAGEWEAAARTELQEAIGRQGFPTSRAFDIWKQGGIVSAMEGWGMQPSQLGPSRVEMEEFEIPWEDLTIGDRIGQGSYGKVYKADWQGSDVAVKVFLEQDLEYHALQEFRAEVAIMRRLRHPNVVLFMGAVTQPPNLSIVTEFCPRGSLYRLLHRPNKDLDERRRIRIALDVAKGMNYLHLRRPPIVHRDLKSPNLLVDKNWNVKVCDFGLSRLKHSTFLSSKSSAGTPEWMAPEVLRNEPSDEKSDVYSFGVILWELATLQQPWGGLNPMQVVGAVGFQHRRLAIPSTVEPAVTSIIQSCFSSDPRLRPSFSDLMDMLKPLQRPILISTSTADPNV